MTDDEALIRAVVDHPGDDTPRLVYADWLDDHDDPARAAYLRAEREAVVTGDVAGLRELAAGLDPVWVARVSRPPVGVCIEADVEIAGRGPPPAAADVDAAEVRLGVTFPAEYRAFLLNYGGCWINNGPTYELPDGQLVRGFEAEWRLYPVGEVGRRSVQPGDALHAGADDWLPPLGEPIENWLRRYVLVGYDPDYIGGLFLGVSGPERGHVRIADTSIEIEVAARLSAARPAFATTFAEFLWMLSNRSPTPALPHPRARDDIPF